MIKLTDIAKNEVKRLIAQSPRPGVFLRVGVRAGGCSGMSYDVKFDDQFKEGVDRSFDVDGVRVVSDVKSLLYVTGMTVDFSADLVGGGFKFINPNVAGSCGCGTSFSVKE
ncbi:MAG: hypothetical protein A3D28_03960 [Omnitrophica bacterium RIFCSPHIGHO2_02_FULL_63_14]|nr:MAG: hypothetical protein A3D28_03960 [Omnitrophica bacterium RIFCSPHIGHO2_02_FULL_63_14]